MTVDGSNEVDMFLAIRVFDKTYGSIAFTPKIVRRGRPLAAVLLYTLDRERNREQLEPELSCLDAIINNSPGFLSDMENKGGLVLDKLLFVKVAYLSETVNRTPTTLATGRNDKFSWLRVKMEGGDRSVEYAQVRGIFKTVYSETYTRVTSQTGVDLQMDDSKDLVFFIRCARVILFSL